eukprot:TRINITY_DN9745_c1_g5_i2.p1 TRINITY_DN9745_c1_g5~~TRINITY_DN9745_c1_g5_i2.p1  ORF type:complete len:404 (+),score=77.74 TRINITY_DN9745_c1_g5_i2:136-1347(+)
MGSNSRVCFKNLPKYASEQKIKEYLGSFTEITDLKLMKTKEGKSRQFAFVGLKTPEEAQKVVKHFNNSYMDTAKLTVEVAREIGKQADGAKDQQRAWSKYSQGSSAYKKRAREEGEQQKSNKQNKKAKKIEKNKSQKSSKGEQLDEDEEFAEFMELMKPRAKSKLWANEEKNKNKDKQREKQEGDDIEERDQVVMDEDVTDLDYLKSRMKQAQQEVEEEEEFDECRLFVRNVPFDTSETELFELFEQFGSVSDVHIVQNKITKQSKGMAYVQFLDSDHASEACEKLNTTSFQGRIIHVTHAKKQQTNQNDFQQPRNEFLKQMGSFKQQKFQSLKDEAGNRETWNALFVRADTVTEAIAAKMGLSNSEFLDKNAEDFARRLALGESQIIFDTIKSLQMLGLWGQ